MLRVSVGCFAALCATTVGLAQSQRTTPTMQMRPDMVVEIRPMPPDIARRAMVLHGALQRPAADWIDRQAAIEAQKKDTDLDGLRAAIRARFEKSLHPDSKRLHMVGMDSGADVEALAFIVLSQAAQDQEADLQSIMQQMQSITKQKDALRQMGEEARQVAISAKPKDRDGNCGTDFCKSLATRMAEVSRMSVPGQAPLRTRAPQKMTYAELDGFAGQLRQDQDSLSDMSEIEQMRLQQAMDRRSKMMETLSNLMKKISNTDNSVVSNMK